MGRPGSVLLRFGRTVFPGRNQLVRPVDRVEGLLLAGLVLLSLLLLPVAATVGSDTYASQQDVARREAAERRQITALIVESKLTQTRETSWHAEPRHTVDARWRAPDGSWRQGRVPGGGDTVPGSSIRIWVDDAGNRVPAPLRPNVVVAMAFAVGTGSWLCGVLALGLVFLAVRSFLDRLRYAAWQREWDRLGPEWRMLMP